MTAQPKRSITEYEYLVLERGSATKHEYYDGRIYAMTGASRTHNLIAGNTLAALHRQLRQTRAKYSQAICGSKCNKPGYIPTQISSFYVESRISRMMHSILS